MASFQPVTNDETKQKVSYVSENLSQHSNNLVTAQCAKDEGIFVPSQETLDKGTCILSCPAARIALEPLYRTTHCGFCARKCQPTALLQVCEKCQLVGWCPSCSGDPRHANECSALKGLFRKFGLWIDSSHLLAVRLFFAQQEDWWKLFECLYELPVLSEGEGAISAVVDSMVVVPQGGVAPSSNSPELYQQVLARVLGCSHAITDLSLPLGNQSLGRTIFLHHSFYNHSCTPNAFLSCSLLSNAASNADTQSVVTARVHLLETVKKGDAITISYIPLSGLSVQERQGRLRGSYGFDCKCPACCCGRTPTILQLPPTADVDSIREIQYSCNERLLAQQQQQQETQDEDELESILSLVHMTQRGIHNQGLPNFHEVGIEAHRLLAMTYSLLGNRTAESKKHHELFFAESTKIGGLFDPVALATQRLEYSRVLLDDDEKQRGAEEKERAIQLLQVALGKHHPWVQSIMKEDEHSNSSSSSKPTAKRQKISEETTSS
jgi:hypothetical protein